MYFRIIQLVLFLMLYSAVANAGFVVVANSDTELNTISKVELKKIYLKKVPLLPNGMPVIVAGLKGGETRNEFNKSVLRKSEASLNSYWSRLLFSGRAEPPRLFHTDEELLQYISKTPGAIGYVDSGTAIGDNVVSVSLY